MLGEIVTICPVLVGPVAMTFEGELLLPACLKRDIWFMRLVSGRIRPDLLGE